MYDLGSAAALGLLGPAPTAPSVPDRCRGAVAPSAVGGLLIAGGRAPPVGPTAGDESGVHA